MVIEEGACACRLPVFPRDSSSKKSTNPSTTFLPSLSFHASPMISLASDLTLDMSVFFFFCSDDPIILGPRPEGDMALYAIAAAENTATPEIRGWAIFAAAAVLATCLA